MIAMANMGNLVVALPPSDIWLTDEQAANFLGYANTYPNSRKTSGFSPRI